MQIKKYKLDHFNSRPQDSIIDTIVIHSMYAKGYKKPTSAISCFKILDENKVSSHFSIDRSGNVWQHVDTENRAWHAGESSLIINKEHKQNFNDFSIGIELIGVLGQRFKRRQYRSLKKLIDKLSNKYPIKYIVSHQIIAPQRKDDPGPSFDWHELKRFSNKKKRSLQFFF